jgi:hypothetical protein
MIRNIKALGPVLLAMAAIGALASSAAQASPGEFHITTQNDKAVVTGQGENLSLLIGGTGIQCKTATLEGTVAQATHGSQLTATQIEVTPTYQECQGFGGINVTVQAHGCKFTIVGTAQLTAEVGITDCTSNTSITIKSSICTITIGNQAQDLTHVTFTNDAKGATTDHHLQAHVTVHNLTYVRDGFFCPQGEATYEGTTTIKAYEDAGTDQVTLHDHQYTKHLCGTEVGILAT